MGSQLKKKKVLLIGHNYSSVMNSLAFGLKQLDVDVRAVSFSPMRTKAQNFDQFYYTVPASTGRLATLFTLLSNAFMLMRLIFWADVVHLFYIPRSWRTRWFDLTLISKFAQKKVVTFMGSEIRRPDIATAKNKYYGEAYKRPDYEYKNENAESSYRLQKYYSDNNYHLVIWDIECYIYKELFPVIHIVPHASVSNYTAVPSREAEHKKELLVVHTPTAPVAKGSDLIVQAMKQIEAADNLRFVMITNLSYEEYNRLMNDADILIDQLIWGGYGISSQQALEMGKVVMTYINEDRIKLYGPDCPVINVTAETIAEEVMSLVKNPDKLEALKGAGISYYQKKHSPKAVALKMLEVYNTIW